MIFGAMIFGVGLGFLAMLVTLVAGAGLPAALLIYCLAGLVSTFGICATRALLCRFGSGTSVTATKQAA